MPMRCCPISAISPTGWRRAADPFEGREDRRPHSNKSCRRLSGALAVAGAFCPAATGWREAWRTARLSHNARWRRLGGGGSPPQERYATALHQPFPSDWRNSEGGAGAVWTPQRAHLMSKAILPSFEAPPMVPAIRAELAEFGAGRKDAGRAPTDFRNAPSLLGCVGEGFAWKVGPGRPFVGALLINFRPCFPHGNLGGAHARSDQQGDPVLRLQHIW